MKIKKFFSFVCCLFLAVSCFTPRTFATPPGNNEKFFLTSKVGGGLQIGIPNACKSANARGVWGDDGRWFTAHGPDRNGHYILRIGQHDDPFGFELIPFRPTLDFFPHFGFEENPDCLVLDESTSSTAILAWPCHRGKNQWWVFENAEGGFHRIRNVATGHYLTWNRGDNRIWGFHWVGPGHADYNGQLWWKN